MGTILFDPSYHFKSMINHSSGSLLILGRKTTLNNKNGYYYLINYFILNEGTKREYLTKIIDSPKYDLYHVHPRYSDSKEIDEIIDRINKLERDEESEDFIYEA